MGAKGKTNNQTLRNEKTIGRVWLVFPFYRSHGKVAPNHRLEATSNISSRGKLYLGFRPRARDVPRQLPVGGHQSLNRNSLPRAQTAV